MEENLSHQEREFFAELKQTALPPDMEEATLKRLQEEGLIPTHKKILVMKNWIYTAAASVIFFVAGFYLANLNIETAPSTEISDLTRYAILLYEDESFQGDNEALVGEYMDWGQQWAQKGKVVGGEKLIMTSEWMGEDFETTPSPGMLAGFFIIQAESYDEALNITRSHPHTNYGGRIELREIEKL